METAVLTVAHDRATRLQGAVHLALLAGFGWATATLVERLLPTMHRARRRTVAAERPGASGPSSAVRASANWPVDTPFRYSQGSSSSMFLVRRK